VEISHDISFLCDVSTNVYFIPLVDGNFGKLSGSNCLSGPCICLYTLEYNTGKLTMLISNNKEEPNMSFASIRLNV
jgi:hypothetical protein